MREEYDIKNLNPRKNPYSNKLKKQITINIDSNIIDFFKSQAADTGIPYQTLINLYLADCVKNNKSLLFRGHKTPVNKQSSSFFFGSESCHDIFVSRVTHFFCKTS